MVRPARLRAAARTIRRARRGDGMSTPVLDKPKTEVRARSRFRLARLGPLVVLALLLVLPYGTISVPGVFDAPLNAPGTLQLLALCLVFGALATGYDLLFGRTGMLSFGHALYFAAGVYGTDILVTKAGLPLWQAAVLALLGSTLL